MSQGTDTFRTQEYTLADQASRDARASFITKTYLHLFGAVMAFVGLEVVLLNLPITESVVRAMLTGAGGYSWLIVLGAFMLVSHVANKWAHSATSIQTQYAGLALYVVAEALIFVPLLYVAQNFGGPGVIKTAGVITVCVFTGLTSVVFFTRKNFSFLGPFLGLMGFVALGFIVCGVLFGFGLGTVFTVLMIGFAAAYILFTTSNVLHEYHIGQHVAASLALFASVALLFWYIIQLLMAFSRD